MKSHLPYEQRASHCSNPTAKKLLLLMAQKKTNLSLSLDVTQKKEFLELADALGREICVLKTHIDIVEDFDLNFIASLTQLAHKHQFLIFEDRKFADIGNTVQLQYTKGIYRIAEWADIVNAHTVVGPGIVEGLQTAGLPKGRGLLLLAQMSTKDGLFDKTYIQNTLTMAKQYPDFVIGFIAMERLSDHPAWVYLTPGVHLSTGKDSLGQQYVSPEKAILERGTDVIIVGRGIYRAADPIATAKIYREEGWDAYQRRL